MPILIPYAKKLYVDIIDAFNDLRLFSSMNNGQLKLLDLKNVGY